MSILATSATEAPNASTVTEHPPALPGPVDATTSGVVEASGGQDAITQGAAGVASDQQAIVPVAAETAVPKAEHGPALGSRVEFKRLDEIWDPAQHTYVLKESASPPPKAKADEFGAYCFTIVRRVDYKTGQPEWTQIELKSRWLKKSCGRLIGDADGISWNTNRPLRVEPEIFIRYFSLLEKHLAKLKDSGGDEAKVSQLDLLVEFIRTEYAAKFEELRGLVARKEINFELLGCLLMPETLLFHHCSLTGQPRVSRLVSCALVPAYDITPAYWNMTAVYVETAGTRSKSKPHFGYSYTRFKISDFRGVYKIYNLSVYPFHWNPRAEELRTQIIERSKKWQGLDGLHHMRYDGVAYTSGETRVMINSRVMIDFVLYQEMCDRIPRVVRPNRDAYYSDSDDEFDEKPEQFPLLDTLSDDVLLLATPVLYGFSLSDKRWLQFNVVNVTEIKWNDEAFARLVLPRAQKDLIRGLVEAQAAQGFEFDDFIEGKGRGLVINLFGPPGVGKTMSAEAVSEHLRRPLYMVGAGELGTTPGNLDSDLSRIFKIGSQWGSVTLLDEADVFLEQRSLHDLQRNALVAVFLRQLEYFPGLLFVTTNRVRAFDEAFQSRIHVSLRYRELSEAARREIWQAFISKLSNFEGPLTVDEETALVSHPFNGRQIKNAVRTASAIATSRKEKVSFPILRDVVEIMEQFEADFRELKNDSAPV